MTKRELELARKLYAIGMSAKCAIDGSVPPRWHNSTKILGHREAWQAVVKFILTNYRRK
jgi:hypothetical protein